MSDETTLLPCPFCGGEAETHETIDGWIASCSSEQSELDGFTHKAQAYGTTKAEAIAAWNTRTPKQAIARDEGICLGYSGATKAGIVGEIVGQRRHFEMGGR